MNNYSYRYGVFHWLIHYLLIILLVEASEFILVEDYTYYDFFGISIGIGIFELHHTTVNYFFDRPGPPASPDEVRAEELCSCTEETGQSTS